jgi:hypothetical protein
VLLFPRLGLVIEDLQIPIANLQKVDVAGDEVTLEVELESAVPVVGEVRARKVHRDFDGDGGRVIDQHEALKRFVALLVRGCGGEHQSRKPCRIVFFPRDRRPEPRGEFGGAMFGCLKHVVREIMTDRIEVVFRGSKVAVARDLEQEFELRSMEPEAVDLPMAERKTADHRLRIEQSSSRGAQTGVCGERLMSAYPRPDRPLGNVDVEAFTDFALRITEGVAEVVGRDRFEDHSGRVSFIFSCGCGEFIETLSALEYLEDSEAVLSPSFFDAEF